MIMKRRKSRSPFTVLTVAMLALVIAGSTAINSVAPARAAEPPVFRITPPAPVFDQTKRLDELAARRKRVAEAIGTNSIMILFSAEPRVYTNDVDYHFRQENNLFYLTNLNQKRATLVLMPGNTALPEVLFLPRRDPRAETWTGHMYSPEEAEYLSGVKEIWEARELGPFMSALNKREAYRPNPANILHSENPSATATGFEGLFAAAEKKEAGLYLLHVPRDGESREFRQEQRFAADWMKNPAGFTIQNAWPIFTEMRLRKSAMELDLLQHAIDISIEAHQRAHAF